MDHPLRSNLRTKRCKAALVANGRSAQRFHSVIWVTQSFAYVPAEIDCFFMMVKTGRVVVRALSESKSVDAQTVESLTLHRT